MRGTRALQVADWTNIRWAPAWDREPWKARSIASVVFTPARGVIHPSFPLRGRWERQVKSVKQAPSPSLAALYKPSFETRLRRGLMHGTRQPARAHTRCVSVFISNI